MNLQQTHVPSARRTFYRICFAALIATASASPLPALDYGCYAPYFGSVGLDEKSQVVGAEAPGIHQRRAERPPYYFIGVPPGDYEVRVHYLDADGENDGSFAVECNGREVVAPTPCHTKTKGRDAAPPETLAARTVTFPATAGEDGLVVRFPRAYDQSYSISGIEVVGGPMTVRIDCGAATGHTDAAGREWLPDRELPFPERVVRFEAPATSGEWIDIGTPMVAAMKAAGVDPIVKWDGKYTRHVNTVFWDRSGRTYVNFSGIGLWAYDPAANTLERADDGSYLSVAKGEETNPTGPGFVLFCSHGFGPKEDYQALSWDGRTIRTWPVDADFGAVDWSHPGTPLIFSRPRHSDDLVISTDSGQTQTLVAEQKNVQMLGALGEGVLVYAVGDRTGEDPANGLYRSTDLGQSWSRQLEGLNVRESANCAGILSLGAKAWLPTPEGLYVTGDRGANWTLVPDSPAFIGKLHAGARDGHLMGFSAAGGWESFDHGRTWQQVLPAPPVANKQKWLQSHRYYDFAWDVANNIVYASAPDAVYRFQR